MLSADVILQVRRLQIRARRAVAGLLGGAYHSAFKGGGLSFAEVREYHPGDDVRRIDWNVTARTGHPFVKRYAEERELTVLLVVDLSASLRFGTGERTKRRAAAELAALLAVAAVGNGDRVGLIGFTDRVETHVPPARGARHALRVLRDVLHFEPSGRGTDVRAALDVLNATHRRRAVVFLCSDFPPGDYADAFRRTAAAHDLIAVRFADPAELELPAVGLLALEDAETGRQLLVDTADSRVRDGFARHARDRRVAFDRLARSVAVDVVDVSPAEDLVDPLVKAFRRREHRRGRP